uniref:ATP synthase F0 subunit 8 n=1 Tax=Lasioglossum parvulum TaxID=1040014 RepID=A0A0S2LU97_9HYME|nr:ATP synthase F0 subunit 8 [Lasioglossum parvulum]
MPQMSPMYWTLLLIFTIMMMYMYISMMYFTLPNPPYLKKIEKKYPKIMKKLIFKN